MCPIFHLRLGILVLFLILFLVGCFYRRFKHSKRLTISQLNLVEDCISEQERSSACNVCFSPNAHFSVHSVTPAVRVLRHSKTLNEKTGSHTP